MKLKKKPNKHKPYYKRQFLEKGKAGAADSYMVTQVDPMDWGEGKGQRHSAIIKAADCSRSIEWCFYFDKHGNLRAGAKAKLDKIIKQLEDFRAACTQ